jgi:hypothetical protein
MTTELATAAARMAAALRNRRCTCITRELWPWKSPVKCERCLALEDYEAVQPKESKGE